MYIPRQHNKWNDFRDSPIIILDCEMTGLDPQKHEVVEIAWIVINGRTYAIESEFAAKVVPLHIESADKESLAISGYSPDEWKDAVSFESVLDKLAVCAPGGHIAGWRVYIDWQFLERGFEKFGIVPQFDYSILDIASLAYGKLWDIDEIKSLSIRRDIPRYYKVKVDKKHSAYKDVLDIYEVFKKLMVPKL